MRPNRFRQEAASRAAHRIVDHILSSTDAGPEYGSAAATTFARMIEEEIDTAIAGFGPSDFDQDGVPEILAGQGDWFGPCLLRLIKKADNDNRDRLRLSFPAYVEMYERWMGRPA